MARLSLRLVKAIYLAAAAVVIVVVLYETFLAGLVALFLTRNLMPDAQRALFETSMQVSSALLVGLIFLGVDALPNVSTDNSSVIWFSFLTVILVGFFGLIIGAFSAMVSGQSSSDPAVLFGAILTCWAVETYYLIWGLSLAITKKRRRIILG